jgi:hypothetical protein
MSTLSEAIKAVKEALLLSEEVKRLVLHTRDMAQEVREHDRRLTRLEAQWETAMKLSGGQLRQLPRA